MTNFTEKKGASGPSSEVQWEPITAHQLCVFVNDPDKLDEGLHEACLEAMDRISNLMDQYHALNN